MKGIILIFLLTLIYGELIQSSLLALIKEEKYRLVLNHYETLNSFYLISLWLHQETLFKSNLGGIPAGTKKYVAV